MGLIKSIKKRLFPTSRRQLDISSFYNLSRSPQSRISALIPNNFFQTWKTSRVDERHARRLIKFRLKNEDFNFYFFDNEKMDEWMYENWKEERIYQAYRSSLFGPSKADIWRLCILYKMGGVYLDFDSSINFSLRKLPVDVSEIVSFESNTVKKAIGLEYTPNYQYFLERNFQQPRLDHPDKALLNWLMVFAPAHPLLRMAIKTIEANLEFFKGRIFASVHRAVVNFAGPIALTKAAWDYVEQGNQLYQSGIDFAGQAKFKDVPEKGSYLGDRLHYACQKERPICS